LVFDAYGTLFDYASAAAGCRDVLGDRIGPLTALWRDKQGAALALTRGGNPDPAAPVFPGPRRALPMSDKTA